VLVNKGQKILDGSVSRIKQEFKENLFSVGADRLPADTEAPYESVGQSEQAYVVRIREGRTPNDVLQYCLQQGVAIRSFHEILPSLNDIFIKLVEGTPTARQFQQISA
jgi:ABC-2 type transport system ATP-binding protein